MIEKLAISDFLAQAKSYPVVDVRSPGEFNHAHIPGAFSLPLFDDEERRIVGTAYKQESRETAIKKGLDFFGPKMSRLVEAAEGIIKLTEGCNGFTTNYQESVNTPKKILVHCWRGGMRSAGVAWLLDLYGFKVYTLTGGYKAFRNFVLKQFEKQYHFKVLAGYTGSGKTETLHSLEKSGEPVIDLEALANHKGSAFGNLGQPPQPSQEMFENLLAMELLKKTNLQPPAAQNQPSYIWIEDESQRIGNLNLPMAFFKQKQESNLYFLDISFEERLDFIVSQYGKFEKEKLINAIIRIKKRLGGLETKTAVNCLIEDDVRNCFAVLLKYYDKWYLKSLYNRSNAEILMKKIPAPKVDPLENISLLTKVKMDILTET